MSLTFTGNIDDDLNTLRELLGNVPDSRRETARRVAVKVEKVINEIRRDYRGDPVAGLGLTFAVFMIAQQMVEASKAGESPLIQLL